MSYRHRVIESVLKEYLASFPVVGITGPRQSGKSTLLRESLSDYRYVTFDDFNTMQMLRDDPMQFINTYNDKVIFDEAQKAPQLFDLIKLAVDNDRDNYGKFALTGSSQFSFIKNITESLAGRMGMLHLLPYQFSEIPAGLRDDAIFKGSYPEIVNREFAYSENWYNAYIETYIERDVRSLSNIGNMHDFRHLITLLAANAGSILNMSTYANDLNVSVGTIKNWVSVLEASYIIYLIPPFYENYGKRLVKSPKVYFYDTGLVASLTGIKSRELYENGPMKGKLFENYVVTEILKKECHTNSHAKLYFYRTNHGVEVDLIVDHLTHRKLIEINSSMTYRRKNIVPMETIYRENDFGYLLYQGVYAPFSENINIMNYKDFLAE